MEKHEIDVKSSLITGGVVGFVSGLLGAVWHGALGYGSMMGIQMMSGYWGNMMGAGTGIATMTIGGLFFGWLIAAVYNYAIKTF